jgi:heat shock protein HslJ
MPVGNWVAAALGAVLAIAPVETGAQEPFPFGRELIMDADPIRGSRRVPNMEIDARGAVDMEMWCNRMRAQFIVAGDTLTVLTGPSTERACSPAQQKADADLMAALQQVTGWRREGTSLTLTGGQPLRFRVPTN